MRGLLQFSKRRTINNEERTMKPVVKLILAALLALAILLPIVLTLILR